MNWTLLAGMLAGCLAQSDPGIHREGRYWVETTKGTLDLGSASRLRITSRGSIILRGDSQARVVSYTFRKRVLAASEADARRLLSGFQLLPLVKGAWGLMQASVPARARVAPDLDIVAPRTLIGVWMETVGGNLKVSGLECEVQAETAGGTIEADQIGGRLVARTGGGDVTIGEVRGPVRCITGGGTIRATRAGGDAFFETAGGEIHVQEVTGALQAVSGGGNIYVARAGATVNARTSGGLIQVKEAAGKVEAETDGGPIRVGAANGVHCESSAGMIFLRGVSGKLRALTTVGSIQAEIPSGVRLENSSLMTDAGDITVFLPSNLAVTIRAVNDTAGNTARIVSDFAEIRTLGLERPDRLQQVAEGVLNGGGPVLMITASNGTIYLRRAK